MTTDLPDSKMNKFQKNNINKMISTEGLEKIGAGNQFICWISNYNSNNEELQNNKNSSNPQNDNEKNSEVFFQGSYFYHLFPVDEQFEINEECIIDHSELNPKLNIKQLNLHKESSFFNHYTPIQVSAFKNSVAILLKSEDRELGNQFSEFKNYFNEILTNLKGKKETFQSYFLPNLPNSFLEQFDEKKLKVKEYLSYEIDISDFESKLTELIGQNTKVHENLIKQLKEESIIKESKINLLKFYQILNSLDTISETKLIILGDFVRQYYKNLGVSDNKVNFLNLYKNTLCFELPQVLLPIKQISLGINHLLLLTIEGEVFSVGDGSKGATGTRNRKYITKPSKVKFPYKNTIILKIAAGGRHSLSLDKNNTIYSWGCGACGCLGLNSTYDSFEPKEITFKVTINKVRQLEAGDNYSAVLCEDGSLFTWGNPQFGRLGHGEGVNTKIPQQVKDISVKAKNDKFRNVKMIKIGYFTMLVVSMKNDIYGFGLQTLIPVKVDDHQFKNNSNSDNDGFIVEKTKDKIYSFKVIPNENKNNKNSQDKNKKGKEIIGLFVGDLFYGFVTKEKDQANFYVGGEYGINEEDDDEDFNEIHNEMREINISLNNMIMNNIDSNRSENKSLPQIKSNLMDESNLKMRKILNGYIPNGYTFQNSNLDRKEKRIKKIVCSENNSVVLSNTGDLYVFGSYIYQVAPQLLENCFRCNQPKGTKIISVALGANHIIMITSSKIVYGAGRNLEGQLGLGYTGKNVDISDPKPIESLNYLNARKCYASENYSVVISMGSVTKVWIFGDIPFLQNSHHINKLLQPKEMNWGEIERMSCASNHMLLLKKDDNDLYTIMSVGNGMYGKLGDGDLNGKNHYEPIRVALPYKEIKNDKEVKLGCGKYTSAVLIKDDKEDNNSYQLYMWGLCHHDFFVNVKDVQSNHSFGESFPLDSTIPVVKPTLITTINADNMAIGEGINYFISSGNLKGVGKFIGIKGSKVKTDGAITKFEKVALGLNHALAISNENKLYGWGSNVMNKLGIEMLDKEEDKNNINENNMDFDNEKYFIDQPRAVEKLHELFQNENEEIKNQIKEKEYENETLQDELKGTPNNNDLMNDNNITDTGNINTNNINNDNILNNEIDNTPTSDEENNNKGDKIDDSDSQKNDEESDQEEEDFEDDTIYARARKIVRNKYYEDLVRDLKEMENELSMKLRDILEKFKELVKKTESAKLKKKAIQNMFYFKFCDSPFNVDFKNSDKNYKKFPPQFVAHKKIYKALLSLLHTHPCYLLKIYENKLMEDKSLYKVIKQLFKSMRNDEYTQLLLITLCKGILEIDLKNFKEKSISNYKIITKFSDGKIELSLFGKLCRFLFRNDSKFVKTQQIVVMCIISNIFSSTISPADCGEDLLLLRNPENEKEDKVELTNYERNNRIGKIMKQFNIFSKDILEGKLLDGNNVFSLNQIGDYKPLFKLNETHKLLIKEIISVFETVTHERDQIYEWISKKFGCIIFNPMIKILENPTKNFLLDASLVAEKTLYNKFMEVSKDNFYSVAYTFKYILTYIAITENFPLPDNEINKQIEKEFKKEPNSPLINNLQKLIKYGKIESDENKDDKKDDKKDDINNESYSFELKFLKEFFMHSLNDSNYIINFSLNELKDLYKVIAHNRDKIRLLDEKSDILEQIIQKDDCLKSGGLDNCPTSLDDIKMIQFKLITKSLCAKPVVNLMRCRNCNSLLLNDFILGNEMSFFNKFEFINENSAKGKYIQLLKKLKKKIDVKNDKMNEFLKEQYDDKDQDYEFKELLHQLFILMAVDLKEDLLISEDIINNKEDLFKTMFTQNTPNIAMKRYSKEIVESNKNMENQKGYYNKLMDVLKEIEIEFKKKIDFSEKQKNTEINDDEDENEKPEISSFLDDIYEKVENGIMKGYGNKELKEMKNTLVLNCKLVKVLRHNDNLPRSEIIIEKLPQSMKKKIQPTRNYAISKLLNNYTIIEFLPQFKKAKDVYSNPNNYKLNIRKNENFEFILTLLQFSNEKSNSFTCGSSNKSTTDVKQLKEITIDNDTLSKIIKSANKGNKNDEKNIQKFNIQDFIEVNSKKFIKLLKKIFGIGFY